MLACSYFFGCALLWFSVQYPRRASQRRLLLFLLAALLGLGWWHASLTHTLVSQDELLLPLTNSHHLIPPFACWLLCCCLAVIIHLSGYDARLRGLERLQARYSLGVCCLLTIGVACAIFLHPAQSVFPNELMPFFTFSCAFPILAYTFGRFTLLDGKVFMRPLLAFTFTITVLYFLQWWLFGPLMLPLMMITGFLPGKMRFVLEMGMALAFQPLYRCFAYGFNRLFFKNPYDDRLVVDEISTALIAVYDATTIFARLSDILTRTVGPQACAFYLPAAYSSFARHYATSTSGALPETLSDDNPVLVALLQQPRLLVAENLLQCTGGAELLLGQAMRARGVAVAVPLLVAEYLQGCLLLTEKQSGDAYLRDDLRVLEALRKQAALALENVRHYEALQTLNVDLEACVEQRTTELAEANRQLLEADQAKDRFLAIVSHELLNPMASIMSCTEVGLLTAESATVMRAFTMIEQSARQQHRLLKDLLDTSRMIHGKLTIDPQPLDLWQVTLDTLARMRPELAEKRLTIHLRPPLPAAELPVLADPARLQQVLGNLLGNARKFTEHGGAITLSGRRDGERCVITVQDTGHGIPAEELPRIFTLFHQQAGHERLGGLGLGLGLVQGIVDLHSGAVRAESPGLEQGSTFTIALPVAEEAKTRQQYDNAIPHARFEVAL
jgi:signal transduction histidine kinase